MWAERRDEDCLFIVNNLWIPVASQSASECAGRCSALLRSCCATDFMHRKLFLDSMYRAGRYTCQGCVITGGLQGQAGCGVGLPSSRHLPTLVISVRAYLHATPAARARPWSDPGATLELLGQVGPTLLELPCGGFAVPARRGSAFPGIAPAPSRIGASTISSWSRDSSSAVPAQQRPPPAYLTAYLHILPSSDATVL